MQMVFRARFLSVLAVVFGALGAALMFVIGSVTTIRAIGVYFGSHEATALSSEAALEAMVEIVSSLDEFLLGLVLLVFAYGVYGLYVVADADAWDQERVKFKAPDWAKVTSVTELKVNLLEVVAVLLAVLFVKGVLTGPESIEWSALVVPLAVGLFAATIWLIRHSERN